MCSARPASGAASARTAQLRTSRHKLPQGEWEVLIKDHHRGFIDWDTYQANQSRIGANTRPRAHQPGTGAVREGCALLQGLATCGTCGRKLAVYYDGPAKSTPGYYCTGTGQLVEGRGTRHLRVGGVAIDAAVAAAFLAALAARRAAGLPGRRPATRGRPRRRARAVAPPGRAGPLPGKPGRAPLPGRRPRQPAGRPRPGDRVEQGAATARRRRGPNSPAASSAPENPDPARETGHPALGDDLAGVWSAATTTDKDRKQLLRTLLDEVGISVRRDHDRSAAPISCCAGKAARSPNCPCRSNASRQQRLRTDEDTIDLLRRLAIHYPDATIAGILNRQRRRTARGLSFTASRVQSLRHHWKIACHQPSDDPQEGELLTVADAAEQLGLAPSTLHRWLGDGFIAGEQITPGAPWRIRLTDDIRALFVDDAPDGWLAMLEATLAYGVSRQTIMQRVKRGELQAVHVRTGRRKGLRIQPPAPTRQPVLIMTISERSSVTMHPSSASMSTSITHVARCNTASSTTPAIASMRSRGPGRNPYERGSNPASTDRAPARLQTRPARPGPRSSGRMFHTAPPAIACWDLRVGCGVVSVGCGFDGDGA